MQTERKIFLYQSWFILCSSIGGLILSSMGLSIGWIIGTLLVASLLSFWQPPKLKINYVQKGIKLYWRQLGQLLIGIELAKNVNLSTLSIFKESGFTVIVVLLVSIGFSLLSGLLLYRFSKVDMLTSLFATSPGGIATMPSIAQDVGANIGIVSVIQLLRVLLVVTIVPVVLFFIGVGGNQDTTNSFVASHTRPFEWVQLMWSGIIVIGALAGIYLGKRIKLPAPWLVGSLIGVILTQTICTVSIGQDINFWWGHGLVVIGQVLIGAGIGSSLKKEMFEGLKKVLFVGIVGTLLLILVMFICAYIVSEITGISFATSVLAFAPGGVVEMSATSVALQTDSTFVVAVQTLRIVLVILLLPPFFRAVNKRKINKHVEFTSNG